MSQHRTLDSRYILVSRKVHGYSLYSAKTRDVGRLAYRSSGRKNPGPYKPINKAANTEPVTGPAYRFAPSSGPQRTQQRSLELGAKKGHNNKGIYR